MATKTLKELKGDLSRWQNRVQLIQQGMYCGVKQYEIAQKIRWFEQEYWKLSRESRDNLALQWRKYYAGVMETAEAALYQAICLASKQHKMQDVIELQAQARDMIKNGVEEIARPDGIDPAEWEHSPPLVNYREARAKVRELEEKIAELDNYRPNGMSVASGGVF